jgi:hypothetical protein
MRFTIGTGYYDNGGDSPAFFKTWMDNTTKHAPCEPEDVVVVNAASTPVENCGGTWLNMQHNYGHVKTMDKGEKFGGWWLGFMTAAMVAYHHKKDFIYKEQDCLAFGPWVEHLYHTADTTKAGVIVGRFNHKYRIEQSLVLVRRKAILGLIQRYLEINASDICPRPELKFLTIMQKWPKAMAFMTMGCGRNRPIPYNASCFYVQKLTDKEMQNLRAKQLI